MYNLQSKIYYSALKQPKLYTNPEMAKKFINRFLQIIIITIKKNDLIKKNTTLFSELGGKNWSQIGGNNQENL